MNSSALPFPLYHGTSTLFLEDILAGGLGAKNPLEELQVGKFIERITPFVDAHLSDTTRYKERRSTFDLMARQVSFSRGFNYQHGHAYLSPSKSTAVSYASNKRYGSELLTYALEFLEMLVVREIPAVTTDVCQEFPQLFKLLDISPAPILIRADQVLSSQLLTEGGGDASPRIQMLIQSYQEDPFWFDGYKQFNFRLMSAISKTQLTVWLINSISYHRSNPEYSLYPLGPREG